MAETRDLIVRIKGDSKDFERSMKDVSSATGSSFKQIAGGVALGTLAVQGFNFAMEKLKEAAQFAISSASDFEQSRIAFDTMLGSAEKSQRLMADISKFAKSTPFELPEVVEGAKRLLAYNIEAEKIIPTLNALGNIAAGVGKDKMPQLILALGQVKAAGKLTGAELRQFTEAGVPLLDMLAKQAGKSAAQVKEDMENGMAPSFADVEAALFSASAEGGKFFNLMQKQSMTFDGTMSNIKDAFGELARNIVGVSNDGTIREGSIFAILSKYAREFYTWVDANKEQIMQFSTAVFTAMGMIFAALWRVGNYMTTIFGPAFQVVAQFVQEWVVPALQDLWMVVQTELMPALREFWQLFGPILTPVLKVVAAFIGGTLIVALMALVGTLRLIIGIVTGVINKFNEWAANVQAVGYGIYNVFAWLAREIPRIIGSVTGAISKPFTDAFNAIKSGVDGAVGKLKDLNPFQRHSPSLVDLVTAGTTEITAQYKDMYKNIGDSASSANIPQSVGQTVAPTTAPAGGGNMVFKPTLNINLGMYAGMPVEKRRIATELWRELVREARAQGVQLPQIGVTPQ